MCMKTAYLKKVVSNIVPVLASVSSMRSVYHTQYSVLQDLFVKFLSIWCRKCYNIENISEILRRMKENGGDFILRRYSGGISFQNTSPVENYEDNLMLTWNPGNTCPSSPRTARALVRVQMMVPSLRRLGDSKSKT